MSSTVLNAIKLVEKDKYRVGSLNDFRKNLVNLGAKCSEDTAYDIKGGNFKVVENFSIVELGFEQDGEQERTFKYLTDGTKKGYLVAGVEEYLDEFGENVGNFFIVKGERARIVVQDEGMHFEVSGFEVSDADIATYPLKNNLGVYWDSTKKNYVVVNNIATAPAGYATAGNKYIIVDYNANIYDGQQTIRLEVSNN